MKKYVCIILMLALIIAMGASSYATDYPSIRLSELSAEECIEFVKNAGISIPDKFEDEMTWAPFIHDIIVQVEENPGVEFYFNYSVLHFFAYDIKREVNEYYGVEEANVQSRAMISAPLQDNITYGNWLTAYQEYNCYAYAIGENEWIDPGIFAWVNMGNQSDTYNYNDQANIYTIACWVEDDLIAKGYTVSPLSTNMPNTAVAPHTNLICVRKDTDGYYKQYDNYIFLVYDYHFMKLCENGYWTHKPGGTNPLRYLYTPTNGREWVGEWSVGSQTFRDEELTYDSEIYFIEYSTTHTYAWKYCGSDQHIRTCTICGDTTGLPMFCRYNSEDLCTLCDHYGGIDQADSIGDKTIICDHA